nr:MAG: RNA-dependent RNA polymerase [Riboviria sp.]
MPRHRKPAKNRRDTRAPVAISREIRASASKSVTLSGTDRLLHSPDVSVFAHGKIVVKEIITAASFDRLAKMASAYQKIKWNSLVFEVDPQMSTATSGGYVASYVGDPTDEFQDGSEAFLRRLTAQQVSKTCSWYAPCRLTVKPTSRLLFTSQDNERRWSSPGQFILAASGQATQKGNVAVYCHWSVTLSVPSDEAEEALVPSMSISRNVFIIKGSKLLASTSTDTTSGTANYDASSYCNADECCPDARVSYVFRLASPFTFNTTIGESGSDPVPFTIRYINASWSGTTWQCQPCENPTGPIGHNADTTQGFLVVGDELLPELDLGGASALKRPHLVASSRRSRSGAKLYLKTYYSPSIATLTTSETESSNSLASNSGQIRCSETSSTPSRDSTSYTAEPSLLRELARLTGLLSSLLFSERPRTLSDISEEDQNDGPVDFDPPA